MTDLNVSFADQQEIYQYLGGSNSLPHYTVVSYITNSINSVEIYVLRRISDGAIVFTAKPTDFGNPLSAANNLQLGSFRLYGDAASSAADAISAASEGGAHPVYGVAWSQGAALVNNVALMVKERHSSTFTGLQIESLNPAPTVLFDRDGFSFEALEGHVQNYRGVYGDLPIDPDTGLRPGDPVSLFGRVAGTLNEVSMRPFTEAAGVHIPDKSFPLNERDWVTRVATPGSNMGDTYPLLLGVQSAMEDVFNPAYSNKAEAIGRLMHGVGEMVYLSATDADAMKALPRLRVAMASLVKIGDTDPNFAKYRGLVHEISAGLDAWKANGYKTTFKGRFELATLGLAIKVLGVGERVGTGSWVKARNYYLAEQDFAANAYRKAKELANKAAGVGSDGINYFDEYYDKWRMNVQGYGTSREAVGHILLDTADEVAISYKAVQLGTQYKASWNAGVGVNGDKVMLQVYDANGIVVNAALFSMENPDLRLSFLGFNVLGPDGTGLTVGSDGSFSGSFFGLQVPAGFGQFYDFTTDGVTVANISGNSSVMYSKNIIGQTTSKTSVFYGLEANLYPLDVQLSHLSQARTIAGVSLAGRMSANGGTSTRAHAGPTGFSYSGSDASGRAVTAGSTASGGSGLSTVRLDRGYSFLSQDERDTIASWGEDISWRLESPSVENPAAPAKQVATVTKKTKDGRTFESYISYAQVGSILGSNIARLVGTDDPWSDLALGALLSTVGTEIGSALSSKTTSARLTLAEATKKFGGDLVDAGAGAISSYLFAELVNGLGDSVPAHAVTSAGGAAVGQIASNLLHVGESVNPQYWVDSLGRTLAPITETKPFGAVVRQWNTNIGPAALNAVGSFVGTWLASELVHFDTVGGQIGASVGGAIGSIMVAGEFVAAAATVTAGMAAAAAAAATATAGVVTAAASTSTFATLAYNLGWAAGPLGAAIGAFAGYILGGLIGSLFGGKPKAWAGEGWNANTGRFETTWSYAKSGGSAAAARSLTESVTGALNGVLVATGSTLIDPTSVVLADLGLRGKSYRLGRNGGVETYADASALIGDAEYYGLEQIVGKLAGGDTYAKRAVVATLAGAAANVGGDSRTGLDASRLSGNLQIASNYVSYLSNIDAIQSLIDSDKVSVFSATWVATLAAAVDLNLDKRSYTDWIGGWNAFIDEVSNGAMDGYAVAPSLIYLTLSGSEQERTFALFDSSMSLTAVYGDTIAAADKLKVKGTGGADLIQVSGDMLQVAAGLTVQGADVSTPVIAAYKIPVAALIDAGDGDDIVRAGDLGNDVLGGAGNDKIVGGKLDDWLFGEDGDDVLFAGDVVGAGVVSEAQLAQANATFTVDAVAVTAVDGGNGDLLDGGAGNDRLYGGKGSDWLKGGDGVDALYGGAGGDILEGGAGDDQGAAGVAAVLGGAGSDQYVFGYGDGNDVIWDEADPAGVAGSTGDSLFNRISQLNAGSLTRNWAGGGSYEVDGSVKGGEDAIVFGVGVTMQNLIMKRSGTTQAPGQDLIIQLTVADPTGVLVNGHVRQVATGDSLTIKDWFESTRKVEWLRFANGDDIRIGDITSYIVGVAGASVILGTNGADWIVGTDGADKIYGLNGDDFGFGGLGNDLVSGDGNNDLVSGGAGDDVAIGGAGNDTVFGDGGNDRVTGGLGDDIVAGGKGDDVIIAGAGNDVIRYARGDGADVLIDDLVDNWDLVWQNGEYVNGYVLNANGTVSKTINVVVGAVTYFDGSKWIDGFNYDYDDATKTLKRHKGALNGVISTSVGAQKTDTLEFAVGVDIQDLMLRRVGNDLEVVVSDVNTTSGFAGASDKITIKDWWSASTGAEIRPIEKFNFVATGTASMSSYAIAGGATDGADNLVGGSVWDWMTGGGGDDILDGGGGNDILSGGEGADKLLGGSAADVLYGGAGDDILDGSTGADQMFGGSGIDIASYQSNGGSQLRAYLGAMFANGGNSIGDIYTDIEGIEGSQGGDRLGGNAGDNILRGAGGGDKLWGGAGDDTYEYNRGDGIDSIYEGAMTVEEVLSPTGALNSAFVADWQLMRYGAATGVAGDYYQYQLIVRRAADNEIVYQSRDGVDFLFPTPETATPGGASWPYADNQWRAGASRGGNASQTVIEHIVAGNGGSDTLAMGAGISLSDLTMSRGANYLKVSLDSTNYVAMFDQLVADRGVETLQLADGLAVDLTALRLGVEAATAGVDVMIGSASNNTFGGQGGDDVLSGGAGADTLDGGAGNDVLEGGTGADTLNGGTDSQTDGLAIKASDPGSYGDTIRYVTSVAAVAIDLAALTATGGDATGDVIVAVNGVSTIENVVGSDAYDDQLSGDGRANRLFGLGGNDVLDGRLGDDVLVGGAGDDTLYGGDGDDALAGEDGVDRLEGGLGKDLLSGGAGDDTLLGQGGDDQLTGDDGDDNLSGGDGADTLGGGAGVDILYGEAGDDKLVGGDGADQLYGGDGNDVLVGEAGNDLFDGGAGDDIYGFDANSGIDRVVDASGVNRVTISGVTSDRIWLTRAGDDLKIAVIGGSTVITLAGYYAASDASLMKEVALDGTSLFLGHAQSLISAMTATSVAPPTAMPTAIAAQAAPFWHAGGKAAPVVVDQALAINEDVVISGQVGAIDDDDNITGYTVVSGPTLGVLQLNAATGAWNYTPTADISGSDRFVLRVTDADNHVVQQTVSVTIAPVNDAPRNVTAPAHLSLLETAGATSLGFFTATDVDDPVSSLVYTLDDSAGGRFEITTAGELKFTNTTAIDFETAQSHTIRVRVSDPHGGSESYVVVPFNVAIEDVNERPGAPGLTSSPLMVGENVADATTTLTTDALATFSLTDPDYPGGPPPGAVTLRLVSDPNNWLVVSGNTVVFRAGLQIDFEALTAGMGILPDSDGDGLDEYVYDFTVAAFDGQLTSSTMAAWVRIEDVNEAPSTPTFSGAVAAIAENDHPVNGVQLARETLARLSSTDHDKSLAYRGVTFTVDNPDFEVFTIAASGQTPAGYGLRLTEAARLNYETKTSVTVNVRAIDGKGGVSAASPITFTITDAEDYWYGNKVVDNTNDTITGEAGRDLIYGLGGNDTLKGGAGNDELDGGIGDDTLQGDDGADLLKGGAGLDTLTGGLGDDTLEGGSEVDSLYGGAGLDTLKGEAGNDWLYGEDGNDTLSGDLGDDTLDGGVGDDLLLGGDGNDTLIGGTGADTLTGGVGADTLKGGAGADRFTGGLDADTVSYADAGGPVTVNLATGGTAGEAAGDVFLDRIEILVGSGNDDTLTGSSFGDFLYGGAGIDHIYGGVGDDWLYGDAGDDVISADDGDDRLFGGVGADTLIGGSGSDTYYIETTSGADTIQNFNSPTSDLDIISYDTGIDRTKLWFRKVGNDLYIDLLGTATTTKVANWYGQGAVNTDNKIDFLFTGPNSSNKVNIEQLVTLMATSGLVDAGATPALDQFSDFLASNAVFNTQWQGLWDGNEKPKVDPVTVPDLSENAGTISIAVKIRDAITVGMQLQVSAVSAANNLVADTSLVSILSVDSIDAAGNAIVKFKPADYKSGAFDIKVVAVDQGKLLSDPQYIRINVNSVANQPNLGFMPLVSGSFVTTSAIPLSIPATLADTDGSESLKIELMGIPSGLQLNKGTPGLDPDGNLIWTLYRDPQNGIDDLTGLQLKRVDPNLAWSQNLTVYVLAYGVERGNWKLSTPRTGSFTVDINGAPTAVSIVGGATSLSVSEDKIPGAAATIGTFTASDPDGDALTYKLVDVNGAAVTDSFFALDPNNGVLTLKAAIDYETYTSRQIYVAASDGKLTSAPKLVTVNVLPVNEYPNIPSVVSQPGTIRPEGAVAADTVIATLKATDPDNTQPEIKITDPSGLFAVRKAGPNYEIYLKAGAVDFEALKAFDGQGWATVTTANGVKQVALKINAYSWDTQYASTSIPITFTVQDVDEAPSAPGVAMVRTSIDETVVAGGPLANFSAIDPEGGPLTFAIADDPDLADFLSVSGGSLTINANTTFNYEALKAMGASAWRTIDAGGIRRVGLRVIAVAKDAAQQSSGATEFWYYVNDVNEAPTAVSIVGGATSLSVSEDKIPGGAATIGTFTAGDPDGDALTYKLVDVNGAAVTDSFFALDPNNGVLTLKAAIDYETYTSRQIYVAASDGKLTSAPKLVTVNVNDVNEKPWVSGWVGGAASKSIAENAGPGTNVGTIAFGDPDTAGSNNAKLKLTLSGSGAEKFSISTEGVISYQRYDIDYETQPHAYILTVKAEDQDGVASTTMLSASTQVTINITDIVENNAPLLDASMDYVSGMTFTQYHVVLSASDADGPGPISWSVMSSYAEVGSLPAVGAWSGSGNTRTFDIGMSYNEDGSTIRESIGYFTVRVEDAAHAYRDYTCRVGGLTFNLIAPIVLDLDGDGVSLVSLAQSTVGFDQDGDGARDRTGWVGAGDGLLVLDRNHNGLIDDGSEIRFSTDEEHAVSDLEGLRAYDSNANGFFDQQDARFDEFQIWQDADGDAVSEAGELKSLAELGITAINLALTRNADADLNSAENVVYGTTQFVRADGTVGEVGDVMFAYQGAPEVTLISSTTSSPNQIALLPPVVIDLDGDGVELVGRANSTVRFDVAGTGQAVRTGWVGADDAFLALDRNGDGKITTGAEISFVGDLEGAVSDLEGLRAFDSNGNGFLDDDDARFAQFKIWQDKNQDGVSQADELHGLGELGVQALNLTQRLTGASAAVTGDNVLYATSDLVKTDGTRLTLGDVMLAYDAAPSAPTTPVDELSGVDRTAASTRNPPASQTGAQDGDGTFSPHSRPVADDQARLALPDEARALAPQSRSGIDLAGILDAARMPSSPLAAVDYGDLAGDGSRSALEASLALAQQTRLQMVQAMAGFSREGAADFGPDALRRGHAQSLALLTALPDIRVR